LVKQYETILDWYKQSEDKAKFVVTVNTLVVGVVNGLVFIGVDRVRAVHALYTLPIWLLLSVCGIALVGSYLLVLRAMWPRHHALDRSLRATERIWFFGDIASMTREEHKAALITWTEQNLEETLIAQNHFLSKNVWTKYEALNWATALTIVALVLLFALGMAYGIAVANLPLQPTGGSSG
jgi:pycsar effector protein